MTQTLRSNFHMSCYNYKKKLSQLLFWPFILAFMYFNFFYRRKIICCMCNDVTGRTLFLNLKYTITVISRPSYSYICVFAKDIAVGCRDALIVNEYSRKHFERESERFRAPLSYRLLILAVLPLLDYPVIFSPFSREIIRLSVHCGFLLSFMSSARFPCMLNILPRYFHRSFQLSHPRTRNFTQPGNVERGVLCGVSMYM